MSYIDGVPLGAVEQKDLELEKSGADLQGDKNKPVLQKETQSTLSGTVYPNVNGTRDDLEGIMSGCEKRYRFSDLAFASLRPPNILAVQNRTGGWQGMLLDFDWCGKHNQVKCPLLMNKHIKWPKGAKPGTFVKKTHALLTFS